MRKIRGFTLIEAMVVVAIIAILVSLAAPSFSSLIQANTISNSVNTLLSDMRYARSESIRRGGDVVMCRSATPESSGATCSSGNWNSGWIVFHDLNGDGVKDATDPILRVQAPLSAIDTISATGSEYRFRFSATGRLPVSEATTLTFGGSNFESHIQRKVCVSVGGRGRIAGDGSSSCS
ncbi:MAG: GspH/FimT family pseudopilin [Burkholderiales bacterium]|nr:GspH/FimT family pseudopilin [Burkholderiales bacterium]